MEPKYRLYGRKCGGFIQDAAYELPRSLLLGNQVNKGQWHERVWVQTHSVSRL